MDMPAQSTRNRWRRGHYALAGLAYSAVIGLGLFAVSPHWIAGPGRAVFAHMLHVRHALKLHRPKKLAGRAVPTRGIDWLTASRSETNPWLVVTK